MDRWPSSDAVRFADSPRFISPQLTKLVDAPPDGDDWIHEIKLDGYRVHARINDREAWPPERKKIEAPAR